MKHSPSLLVAALLMFSFLSGCSRHKDASATVPDFAELTVTPSMKGWELYTWPEGNTWKFSFLMGTNRLKSLPEVTSLNGAGVLVRVTGLDSAKMVLNKFPAGESITLLGEGWLSNVWQGQHGNLQLPPRTIISQLETFATQKNLSFTVAN